MAEEAARLSLELLDGQREEPDRHLLAGGDHHVLLALARPLGEVGGELEEPVGLARHGRDDDHHVVAVLAGGEGAARHVADSIEVADGGSAVFLDDEGHEGARL
jgi:hypothetical protein